MSRLFAIETEKGHPRTEIGKASAPPGTLGLNTQAVIPRTRSLDEVEVGVLLTGLFDHGLK